jgi:nucleoside-diphosphate-sugar epimerase
VGRNDTEGIIRTNHAGTVALANGSIAAGVKRFIFTSTGNVYGTDYQRPSKEDDVVNIHDPRAYPSSKIAAENELISLHKCRGCHLKA